MIVFCDTFDHEDFPVYVMPGENIRARLDAAQGNPMQRLMEVYNYALPLEDQLNERRAYNL